MDVNRKVLVVSFLLCSSVVAFFVAPKFLNSEQKARTYYTQGVDFLNRKDYQNAYFNFSKIKTNSKYHQLALYRQATCAGALGDSKTALDKYQTFAHRYQKSFLSPKATYEYAKALFNQKKYDDSFKVFAYVNQAFPSTDYAIGANYFLGAILKIKAKEKFLNAPESNSYIVEESIKENYNQEILKKGVAFWLEYLEQCPNCTYSSLIANEISQVQNSPTSKTLAEIGKVFYLNGQLDKAIDYLQKGLPNQHWNYLVLAFLKNNNLESARKVFDENFVKNGRNISYDELKEVAYAYANNAVSDKLFYWKNLLKISEENKIPIQDFILYNLAQQTQSAYESAKYKEKLLNQYPRSPYANFASWELFRYFYKNAETDKALQLGLRHLSFYPQSETEPAVLFWLGKIYLNQKQKSKANEYFQKLINAYPDDYYAYRAHSMYSHNNLNWHKNGAHTLERAEQENVIAFPLKYTDWSETDNALVQLALDSGDVHILDDLQFDNKIIKSWILHKNKQISLSATLARDWLKEQHPRPSFNETPYKLAYPLFYTHEIEQFCAGLGLDSFLIIGLIKEESYFNQNAQSSVGARGLMQLMPATATFIAANKNLKLNSLDELTQPAKNIELGCNYFKFIKDELHNSNLLAVAAYNGGPASVASWLNKKDYADFDEFVENITYPETRNYVKKVYKAYWNYLNIYSDF